MRIIIATIFILLAINIYAVTLEEINVFGEKYTKEELNKNPSVEIITREKIDKLSPSSTLDLLGYASGIQITSYNKANSTISMGGFVGDKAGFNNVIMINGRRVNPVDQSSFDVNSIPVEMIERVEISYGANSTLFGDSATGGAINIVTRKPIKSGGFIKAEAGSYNTTDFFAQGNYAGERISLLLNADRYRTDGYRDNGRYNKDSVNGEFIYYGDNFDLGFNGLYIDKDFGLPGGLTKDIIEEYDREHTENPDDGSSDYEWMAGTNAKFYTEFGDIIVDVSRYERKRNTDWILSNYKRKDELERTLVAPSYRLNVKHGDYSNTFTAGYLYEETDLKVITDNSELTREKESFYFTDKSEWNNISVEGGYRYSDMEDDYSSDGISKDFDAEAYFVKAGYSLNGSNFVYLKYDKSFRFPATDEINEMGGLNPEIDKQVNKTYEIGFKSNHDMYHLDLIVYKQESDDEIFTNPDYYTMGYTEPANTNLDTEKNVAIVRFGINRKNTIFDVAYTYTDSEIDSGAWKGNKAPLVSEHTVKANVGYEFDNGLGFYYFYKYFSGFYQGNDYENAADKTGGYSVSDVKLRYVFKNFEAYLKVNNIFDKEYSNYVFYSEWVGTSYYYPAAERNYLAGVKFKF